MEQEMEKHQREHKIQLLKNKERGQESEFSISCPCDAANNTSVTLKDEESCDQRFALL